MIRYKEVKMKSTSVIVWFGMVHRIGDRRRTTLQFFNTENTRHRLILPPNKELISGVCFAYTDVYYIDHHRLARGI